MRTCGSSDTIRSRAKAKKPFITLSTTMSAATPTATPATLRPAMTEMSDTRFRETR